ncbi:MAG: ribosome recycling factor [Oscillospiraceae bacterium]|nr:ribosome recycling factor [Oscillospiraceae bacterium]
MEEIFAKTKEKMTKTISALESEYSAIRAGRANPQILDRVTVDYYGTATPINQLASVSATEARVLTVQPWDKSVLKAIEKAIQTSDIGINPMNDGNVIHLTFPPLTEGRRKELCKDIQKTAENSKVAIRSIRRDAIEKLKAKKKSSEITEDDLKDGEKKIQKFTDDFVADIDKIAAVKEKEIMDI